MAKSKTEKKKNCFIVMPITTPLERVEDYGDDEKHFDHVLDHLFMPAIRNAGFEPIPPKSAGSDIIQAEIIKQLSSCELVLCDMSLLNPNVFFEFGIRTALNQPVALVVDERTQKIPFDTSIINFHKYNSSLDVWTIEQEVNELATHLKTAARKSKGLNALWKYFGVAQTGEFRPEDATLADKVNLLLQEVRLIKQEVRLIKEEQGYLVEKQSSLTPAEGFGVGRTHALRLFDERMPRRNPLKEDLKLVSGDLKSLVDKTERLMKAVDKLDKPKKKKEKPK